MRLVNGVDQIMKVMKMMKLQLGLMTTMADFDLLQIVPPMMAIDT